MTAPPMQAAACRPRRPLRAAAMRLAAIALGLLPLLLLEAAARLWGPAEPVRMSDPYVSFAGTVPLFVPDATGTRYETAPERLEFFRPQSFAVQKGARTFRIFCLGGSTVQGRPYSVETAFPEWLRLDLQAARPDLDFEVVNCGGVSYASYRLVPILRELLAYQADLFIVYTGHNEFLEDRTYAPQKRTPPLLPKLNQWLMRSRAYALARRAVAVRRAPPAAPAPKTVLPAEVQARLDFAGGLESYHRDDVWHAGVVAHFRLNLETMAQLARAAGVPLILLDPVANLKDSPPFKSEFAAGLTPAERDRIVALWDAAHRLDWSDAWGKRALLEQAIALDGRHAGLLYLMGACERHLGRYAAARAWFTRAKDEDVCPLRILEPMRAAIREVAREAGAPLVDVDALITERTEDGIPGDEWLLDHVHPTLAGHQLIADALFETMCGMGLIEQPAGWAAARDRLRAAHLAALDPAYYAHGAERLGRLQAWSRGRIPTPPSRTAVD